MDKFPTITFQIPSPDGTAYIQILEYPDKPGEIYRIIFQLGKAASPVNAWADALARMVSAALNNGVSINSILDELSEITTDKSVRHGTMFCRSGPEALYIALLQYRNENGLVEIPTSPLTSRPPRLNANASNRD